MGDCPPHAGKHILPASDQALDKIANRVGLVIRHLLEYVENQSDERFVLRQLSILRTFSMDRESDLTAHLYTDHRTAAVDRRADICHRC